MTPERLELRVPSLCFIIECQCSEAVETASRLFTAVYFIELVIY